MSPETRNETKPSGDRQGDYQARALADLRRRANQQECRANQRWAALDSQAVALRQRITAANSEGNARAAELAKRALGKVIAGMKKLLTRELAAQSAGFPWEPWTRG